MEGGQDESATYPELNDRAVSRGECGKGVSIKDGPGSLLSKGLSGGAAYKGGNSRTRWWSSEVQDQKIGFEQRVKKLKMPLRLQMEMRSKWWDLSGRHVLLTLVRSTDPRGTQGRPPSLKARGPSCAFYCQVRQRQEEKGTRASSQSFEECSASTRENFTRGNREL